MTDTRLDAGEETAASDEEGVGVGEVEVSDSSMLRARQQIPPWIPGAAKSNLVALLVKILQISY